MAIFKPAGGIEGLSGTHGGVVFQRLIRNGSARTAASRRTPATAAQTTSRATLGYAVRAWSSLTDAQRTEWTAYAQDLSDLLDPPGVIRQSGYNLFVAQRAIALRNGFSLVDVPAAGTPGRAASQALLFDVIDSGATLRGRFLRDTTDSNYTTARASVYVTPPQPPSRPRFQDRFTYVGSYAYGLDGTPTAGFPLLFSLPHLVPPGWLFGARIRTVTSEGNYGQRINYIVRTVPTGQRLAFRIRPNLEFGEGQSVERTPSNLFVVTRFATPPVDQISLDMTAAGADTIGELAALIAASIPFDITDLDAAVTAQASTNIAPFGITPTPLSEQPLMILIPA